MTRRKVEMRAPKGARCQEASPLSGKFYIPCGQPATQVVKTNDKHAYTMCQMCADHNVRNRGARVVQADEVVEIWDGKVS